MEEKKKYKAPEVEMNGGILEDPAMAVKCGESTVFNPVQQHLLRMFAYDGSEERLSDLKKFLTKYYSELLNKELDDLWDSGVIKIG